MNPLRQVLLFDAVQRIAMFRPWLPSDYDIPVVPTRGKYWCALVGTVGILVPILLATSAPDEWVRQDTPVWWMLLVAGLMLIADVFAQIRTLEDPIIIPFSHGIVLSAVWAAGIDWRLVLILGVVRGYLTLLVFNRGQRPTLSAWLAAYHNMAQFQAQIIAAGLVGHYLPQAFGDAVHVMFWVVAGVMLLVYALFDPLITMGLHIVAGFPSRQLWTVQGLNEIKDLQFNILFLVLGMVAVDTELIFTIAMLAPTLLTASVTHTLESLALSEAKLRLDGLTGIANRVHFWDRLDHEYRVRPDDIAVIMIDIDDFKKLNDKHGHLEGDRALIAMAEALRSETRGDDVAARYGGEEFIVLLPGADEEKALGVAERIRVAAAEALSDWNCTVSSGVAVSDARHASARVLVDAADNALYLAKRSGKNRVQAAQPADFERAVKNLAESADRQRRHDEAEDPAS